MWRQQVLQPPHGVVYVAAKSFYFGVGGSTTSFAELVKADGILECTQVCVTVCVRLCVVCVCVCVYMCVCVVLARERVGVCQEV